MDQQQKPDSPALPSCETVSHSLVEQETQESHVVNSHLQARKKQFLVGVTGQGPRQFTRGKMSEPPRPEGSFDGQMGSTREECPDTKPHATPVDVEAFVEEQRQLLHSVYRDLTDDEKERFDRYVRPQMYKGGDE